MSKLLPLLLAMLLLFSACSPSEVENKPFELTYQDIVYSGTYTGSWQDKLPNGEGTFSFDDGKNVFTYTGTWNQGAMSGAGSLTASQFLIKFSDVDRLGYYEGDTANGVPQGNGSFTAINSNGSKYCYTGEFVNGIFDGQGARRFEDKPYADEVGTFTAGDFTPTPLELLAYFGQEENAEFGIRSLSAEFLTNHSDTFTANTIEGLDAFVDTEFRYEAYTKSPDKSGDKLAKLTGLQIVQISEYSVCNYDSVTYILAADTDYNYYYIYYLGSVDVYEGDYISAYLLPLDYFTYENVGGGETWAIACAAAYISK